MTEMLFRSDPYCQKTSALVTGRTDEGGVILDATIFYPRGGGQPGDSGRLDWDGGAIGIAETVRGDRGEIVLVPAEPEPLPPVGSRVTQTLDWERRLQHMRAHTALHLLSVVVPLPVTGGSIGAGRGRLDFDMPEMVVDKAELEAELNGLIERDLPVTEHWITDEELAASPGLVKTMSVRPPAGQGRVRLIVIGDGGGQVDIQPCGGTHVARTGEIGRVAIGKIEKKGRRNRRVNLLLAD